MSREAIGKTDRVLYLCIIGYVMLFLLRSIVFICQTFKHVKQFFLCPFAGGFDGFFTHYPELCFNTPVMCSNHLEPVVSGRKTPLYDQVS